MEPSYWTARDGERDSDNPENRFAMAVLQAAHSIWSHPLHDVIVMNAIKCGYYLRAALILFVVLCVWILFEGGYYLGYVFYLNKYGMYVHTYMLTQHKVHHHSGEYHESFNVL